MASQSVTEVCTIKVVKDGIGQSSMFSHHERLGKAPVSYGRHSGSSENTSHM